MASLIDTSTSSSRKGGTISSMVERFRFASPMSREEREKQRLNSSAIAPESEFWWTRKDGVPPVSAVDTSIRDTETSSKPPNGQDTAQQSAPAQDDGNAGSLHASFASYLSESSVSTQQPQYRYSSSNSAPIDAA
jgi:hypothetical protein